MGNLIIYGLILFIIIFVMLLKSKKGHKAIKGNGIRFLVPVVVLGFVFPLTINQLMHIPGQTFHFPAYWEILIAGLLGILFGWIMLTQTAYEKREDGNVYSKSNKNFKFVLIAIIAIRIILSQYFKSMDYTEFTVLTMVLAFIYVGIWRVGSFVKFHQVKATN